MNRLCRCSTSSFWIAAMVAAALPVSLIFLCWTVSLWHIFRAGRMAFGVGCGLVYAGLAFVLSRLGRGCTSSPTWFGWTPNGSSESSRSTPASAGSWRSTPDSGALAVIAPGTTSGWPGMAPGESSNETAGWHVQPPAGGGGVVIERSLNYKAPPSKPIWTSQHAIQGSPFSSSLRAVRGFRPVVVSPRPMAYFSIGGRSADRVALSGRTNCQVRWGIVDLLVGAFPFRLGTRPGSYSRRNGPNSTTALAGEPGSGDSGSCWGPLIWPDRTKDEHAPTAGRSGVVGVGLLALQQSAYDPQFGLDINYWLHPWEGDTPHPGSFIDWLFGVPRVGS